MASAYNIEKWRMLYAFGMFDLFFVILYNHS